MKRLLFSIRDSKAETFTPLAMFNTRMEAIRGMSAEVSNPESSYSKYAEDFALFEMGWFDLVTGELLGYDQPVHVINAFELRPQFSAQRPVVL